MVPGSTLRYGSNFMRLTFSPRLSSRQPMEAAASPLPKEDTTPPVTKMYFADIRSSLYFVLESCAGWGARLIMAEKFRDGNGGCCGSSAEAKAAPVFAFDAGPKAAVPGSACVRERSCSV